MHLGLHHQHAHARTSTVGKRFLVRGVDAVTYVVSFATIFSSTDQVRLIYSSRSAVGVSLLTWAFFLFSSAVWLVYGVVHKDRVLTIVQALWVVLNALVVVGILLYR